MMKIANGLAVGHIDSSIGIMLEDNSSLFDRFAYAMLTCIDSNTDLARLLVSSPVLKKLPPCDVLSQSIVMPTKRLGDLVKTINIFTGFDEIWCFATRPDVARPSGVSIVAPFDILEESLDPALGDWIYQTNCQLGLGDGVGLNYVTPDRALAAILESL
jgi:hypothetical protein